MGLLSKLNRIVKSKYPFFRILLNRSRVNAMIIARNVFIRNFSRFITTRDRDWFYNFVKISWLRREITKILLNLLFFFSYS